jgi:hypothetical protein
MPVNPDAWFEHECTSRVALNLAGAYCKLAKARADQPMAPSYDEILEYVDISVDHYIPARDELAAMGAIRVTPIIAEPAEIELRMLPIGAD